MTSPRIPVLRGQLVGITVVALCCTPLAQESVSEEDLPTYDLAAQEYLLFDDGSGVRGPCMADDTTVAFLESHQPSLTLVRPSGLQRVGRRGRGPGEFENPVDVLCPGEGRLLVRERGRRAHLFHADGQYLHSVLLPGGPHSVLLATLVGGVRAGQLYFVSSGMESTLSPSATAGSPADSTVVLGFAFGDTVAGIVARLRPVQLTTTRVSNGDLTVPTPLQERDIFIALSDSGFAIVRVSQGTIERHRQGQATVFDVTWLSRMPTTLATRDSLDRFWREHPNAAFRDARMPVPEFYPRILSAHADAQGRFWLEVPGGRFVVLSADARPLAWVSFNAGSRLLGVIHDAAYVLREGEAGSEVYQVQLPAELREGSNHGR